MQENPFQEERQGRNVDNLMKVGMGYDVHRLTEDRDLILGGVKIDWEKGLLGHSDADVLIHAIMDALLPKVNSSKKKIFSAANQVRLQIFFHRALK